MSSSNSSKSNTSQKSTNGSAPNNKEKEPQIEILHRKQLGGRIFILNRPSALNALNLGMIRNLMPQLQAWEQSDLVNVIIIKSNDPRAFCAGGDVKDLILRRKSGDNNIAQFFFEEYNLNHYIATSATPVVAFLNGITMGGGVGISVHAPFRIATENTLFAMPETAIGLHPDVGGSFFLPRLDGQLGTYLGLTGARLQGSDVFLSGVATHYVPSQRLPDLEERLCELETSDWSVVNAAVEEFTEVPEKSLELGQHREVIDRCFGFDTVEEILAALEKEVMSNTGDFAQKTLKTLQTMSPSSLKVTLKQIREGKKLDIASCFRMEWALSSHAAKSHDFAEGVTSRLLTKPARQPQWKPATLSAVSNDDVDKIFTAKPNPALTLSKPVTYYNYPHRFLALPTENDIRKVITGENKSVGDYAFEDINSVVSWFEKNWPTKDVIDECRNSVVESGSGKGSGSGAKGIKDMIGGKSGKDLETLGGGGGVKVGLKIKVKEVVDRCCEVTEEGGLRWKYPYPV
ncbi:ClpP/crotonase-like domain-containing protein [Paraphysoderma sedebokerense]|nr:ClpP/crotonase-like domain-containing protein [Paraphysoderma sedebokerense]